MNAKTVMIVGVLALFLPALAGAQKSVSESMAAKVTATIDAIDPTNRLITLKNDDGDVETFQAGPEIARFSELKAGDKVTFHYTGSIAFDVRKPSEAPKTPGAAVSLSKGTGPKPSAALYKNESATVTVEAVDPKVPSITVRDEGGNKITHQVKEENRKALDGVKPGDRIDISYTETLAIDVVVPKSK